MMRVGLAGLAVSIFLAAPAAPKPTDPVKLDRAVVEAGRWGEQLGQAIATATEAFEELNQKVVALAGTGLAGPTAVAAVPDLRRLVELNRANLRRSNALLAALPPYPAGVPSEISGEQLVADARAQNDRFLDLLANYDTVFEAIAKADAEALRRAMPKMLEGAYTLLGQQKLMFRNRQASYPKSNSTHQALGIAVQIYRAMESVGRRTMAIRHGDPSISATALADLRAEMQRVAADASALAAAGRRNLRREMDEFQALRRSSSKDSAQARLADRALAVSALEEKVFAIGDRLAAFAAEQAQSTAVQIRQAPSSFPLAPLTKLESDFMDVGAEQVALAGDGPR
jgi:hypothetical protein